MQSVTPAGALVGRDSERALLTGLVRDVARGRGGSVLIEGEPGIGKSALVRATVAEAPEGAVVVHCAGGKDRTGLVTAFLLKVAGVSDEHIAEDYAISEERLKSRHDRWLADAESDEERERLRRIMVTPRESMLGVLHELERRHGSIEGYLKAGGLRDDDLERVRTRLR